MKKASKNSWKTTPIQVPYRIETSISFNQEHFDKITMGSIPESMDDHWFIYYSDYRIYFFRSWTGYQIYQCQIHKIGDDRYEILDFIVERNPKRYGSIDDNHDKALFTDILNHWFLERRYQNHIRNSILGSVVGDALGVPVEFQCREKLNINPVTDMIGNGTYSLPAGTWSDDSSLTLCLAEELIQGYDLRRIGDSFVRWLYENHWTPHGKVFDVGNATRQAIGRIRNGTEPQLAGNNGEYSNGNGSLMRILPLLFYIRYVEKDKDRYKIVKDVSSITHAHTRSCLACYYYLEFARALCDIEYPNYGYEQANTSFNKLTRGLKIEQNEISYFNRLLAGNMANLSVNDIKSSGYVIDTLEASIWCILTTKSYIEAVLKAVNLGEDTDTIAAITGGLAGILYGTDSIPKEWLQKVARLNDIEALISKFTRQYRQASY